MGSFVYNYAHRYLEGTKVWRGRSRCPHCKHDLAAKDLVPVLSYLYFRARCRYCKKPISWQYPVAELVTGSLFAIIYAWLNPSALTAVAVVTLGYYWYLACVAVIISTVDLRAKIIPDRVIGPAVVVTLAFLIFKSLDSSLGGGGLGAHLLTGLGAGLAFLSIVMVSNGRWMGGGDVKLFALIGLVLGWPGLLVGAMSAFWIGAAVSLGLIAFGSKKLADQIPFGPFLLLGAAIALGWGSGLADWYVKLVT